METVFAGSSQRRAAPSSHLVICGWEWQGGIGRLYGSAEFHLTGENLVVSQNEGTPI